MNGIREHRLLHAMQEGPEAMPVAAVPVEQRILNEMQNMKARVLRVKGALTLDRKLAVERQEKIIEAKFDDIQHRVKNENKEYQEERNALLREVDELVSYAEYQAAQQAENHQAGRIEDGEDRLKGVTVEKSGERKHIFIKASKDETMRFTYVSRSPEIARVLGVMTFDARTVSMNMQNRFHVSRTKDKEGNDYFVITPDEAFDGTFTVYIGNKSKTVDWLNTASEQTLELQQKQQKERSETQSIEDLKKDLKAAAEKLADIATQIGNLKTEEDIIRELPELQKQKKELEQRIADLRKKILEHRQRHGLTMEGQTPDRPLPIINGVNAPVTEVLSPEEVARQKRLQEIQTYIEGKESHIAMLKSEEQAISERMQTIRILLTNPDPNEPILTEQQEKVLEDELKTKQVELAYMKAEIRRQVVFLGQSKQGLEKLQRKEK